MPGRDSRKQDPFARINNWDDGYDGKEMSGGRGPAPERGGSRRHADNYRPRRRDPSPLSDYDAPRRRSYRDDSPPPYRSVESHSPPHRSRHNDEPVQRRRSAREAPHSRRQATRSPSPPPRRAERDERRRPEQQRYRSPSPADRRRRSSPNRHHERPASPPRHREQPHPGRPGLARAKTTTSIGLSPRWQKAATAALQAGSLAALSARSQPGPWAGAKGIKVASAALGAGFMKATSKDNEDKRQPSGGHHGGHHGEHGSGGASRGFGGGSGGGIKSKGVEMLGTALSGFVAQQMAKKAQKVAERF